MALEHSCPSAGDIGDGLPEDDVDRDHEDDTRDSPSPACMDVEPGEFVRGPQGHSWIVEDVEGDEPAAIVEIRRFGTRSNIRRMTRHALGAAAGWQQ